MGELKGVVIAPLLFAVLVTYLLSPLVNYLQKQKIPRPLGILIIYLFLAALILLFALNLLPTLQDELQDLVASLPTYTQKLTNFIEYLEGNYQRFNLPANIRQALNENLTQLQKSLTANLEKLPQYLVAFFCHAFALLLVPLYVFYLLRDHVLLKKRLLAIIPPSFRQNARDALQEIDQTLGAYIRGIFIVSFSVGAMIYLGLLFFGVKFALFFGIINALTNIIPYFGPLIGAFPVAAVVLLQSPALIWRVVLWIMLVQQIESQFISPQVFGRSLGFHPLTIIIALLLGGIYMGFLGLVVIIPLLAILRTIFLHFYPLIKHVILENNRKK
ncbi:MAG: AI-2E family transporter [Firmicutes bacterium]|nr:AI-2E family transporter [Bacillota bacterium]